MIVLAILDKYIFDRYSRMILNLPALYISFYFFAALPSLCKFPYCKINGSLHLKHIHQGCQIFSFSGAKQEFAAYVTVEQN